MKSGKLGVFLSWSGEQSGAIAEILGAWLTKFFPQKIEPFHSAIATPKGARWYSEISTALEKCEIGLICLTRDNLRAPWIHFEAGALSKRIDSSRVCPILLGISTNDLEWPLAGFQAAVFDEKNIKRVLEMINVELKGQALTNLDDEFELRWPSLEKKVAKELSRKRTAPVSLHAHEKALSGEIVDLGRLTVRLKNEFTGRLSSNVGYILGEMSTNLESPYPGDRDRLVDAIGHCRRGYESLKEIGGAAEFMALNNLVYYSTFLDWLPPETETLLKQGRSLLEAGEHKNATDLVLTGCKAILRFSSEVKERETAYKKITALMNGDLSDKQRKEAEFYLKFFPAPAAGRTESTRRAKQGKVSTRVRQRPAKKGNAPRGK